MSLEECFPEPSGQPDKPKLSRHQQAKAIDPAKPLSRKESRFVAEYLIDQNATQALKRLGRGGKYPDRRAVEVMARANVRKAVEDALEAQAKACEVTVARLEKAWSKYAFAEDVKIAGPIQHNHVQNALEHLGKLKGAYKPEQQTTIPVVFQFLNGPPLPVETVIEGSARPVQPDTQVPGRVLTPPK